MQFIEVYVVPDTGEETAEFWATLGRDLGIPFFVHAPHYSHGLCLACAQREESNRKLIEESLRFADRLGAQKVVIHPGVNGMIEETARQIALLFDERLVLENKPRHGHGENLMCNGALPEEIDFVMRETGVGFCLDIGHAITAANGFGVSRWDFLRRFFALKPSLLHITDGHWDSFLDEHLHFGEGDFPLEEIVGEIIRVGLGDVFVTNEAYKKSSEELDDFRQDMEYLERLYTKVYRTCEESR
ncbi:TIM barrel protein [Thermospira aquatica]|uniref:TIM barrel protein n=1 Tax=Thermospira aquatica TaxID=2828656 RepID=A0AAX3BB18_9SPIR|nr:TIM barrel protein [Thermospira aquatica]URA09471.1 TIM barrel protein [Thermospira aquatica]